LHARLKKHNAGEVPDISKFRPWKIKTAVAFTNRERACDFERYLKNRVRSRFCKKAALASLAYRLSLMTACGYKAPGCSQTWTERDQQLPW
jgi:predicted GIY-YIG superfamily endonuclease